MEGTLWKWTNYWNGWQTRWFVLKNGILSYYMSQEEVNQGCKGSMKVSALEIMVNSVDQTRMDLVVPGEQHIYLRAASSQERQQWLVALGSCKACLTTKHRKESVADCNPDSIKSKTSELLLYCDLLTQQVHMIKTAAADGKQPDIQKLSEASCLLTATCDTFIKTLDDCMRLSHFSPNSQDLPDNVFNYNQAKMTNKPIVPLMRINSTERKT